MSGPGSTSAERPKRNTWAIPSATDTAATSAATYVAVGGIADPPGLDAGGASMPATAVAVADASRARCAEATPIPDTRTGAYAVDLDLCARVPDGYLSVTLVTWVACARHRRRG